MAISWQLRGLRGLLRGSTWSLLCRGHTLRKAASYEPRIAILGISGDTWLTRGKYGIYVAVRGSYWALTGSTWRLLPRKISPIYCRVSYVTVNEDTLVSAA